MAGKKLGRPPLPPDIKKVMVTAKVAPATAAILNAERTRTGKSLGILIDERFATPTTGETP